MMEPSILGREIGMRVSHIPAMQLALVLEMRNAASRAELNVRSAFLTNLAALDNNHHDGYPRGRQSSYRCMTVKLKTQRTTQARNALGGRPKVATEPVVQVGSNQKPGKRTIAKPTVDGADAGILQEFGDAVGLWIVTLSQVFFYFISSYLRTIVMVDGKVDGTAAFCAPCSFCSVDWVHHDVSACNVLRSGKIGKIDGLECTKHMDYKTTHKGETVMLDFVACEVGVQDYLFEPHVCRPFGYERECPFRSNPLRDTESVWWIATWAVYYPAVQAGKPLSEQVRCFHELFPGQRGERTNASLTALKFKVPTLFMQHCQVPMAVGVSPGGGDEDLVVRGARYKRGE
ncbi:hypothetical protein EDD15DRAFT_2196896 [Pisolithus albus]|nr:hypothetical protein EDD15DRAFT_2200388 [Pisolithus albus]KAI5992696.1 hypothetical protein EDD15DRAFT_2196896 [Pisolithus albus]